MMNLISWTGWTKEDWKDTISLAVQGLGIGVLVITLSCVMILIG